jgi:hypothetical protein
MVLVLVAVGGIWCKAAFVATNSISKPEVGSSEGARLMGGADLCSCVVDAYVGGADEFIDGARGIVEVAEPIVSSYDGGASLCVETAAACMDNNGGSAGGGKLGFLSIVGAGVGAAGVGVTGAMSS